MKTKYYILFILCLFLTASCSKDEDPSIHLETTGDITIASYVGAKATIRFSSSREWQARTNADWFTFSPSSGGDGACEIVVTAKNGNATGKNRTGILMLSSGSLSKSITIKQESRNTTEDKQVRTLHTASKGKGIPIVLMGDGFIDKEINNGTYDKFMNLAFENLFTEEPIKSLRDYFNVYAVTAVSKNNRFGSGSETVFECELEGGKSTGISGNDDKVFEYVQCVKGIDWTKTLSVVILNTTFYAGTTYFGFSTANNKKMTEFAIAYCPIINYPKNEDFRQVLVHEAIGHGFAKLNDEYSYEEMGTMPDDEIEEAKELQTLGWFQNVDFTNNPNEVLWSEFLADKRYTSENLSVFEGACTYIKGAYRPSDDSMMNSNKLGFNAPSRRSLYNKVMSLGLNAKPSYEEFVAFDVQHKPTTRSVATTFSTISRPPFARPRFANKTLGEK